MQPQQTIQTIKTDTGSDPHGQKIRFGDFFFTWVSYIFGLFSLLVLIGVISGFLGGGMTSRSSEYFGNVQDFFSWIFVLLPLLFLFWMVSIAKKDRIFLLYPFVVFYLVGPIVYSSVISSAVSQKFPFLIHNNLTDNRFIATALISYGLVYTFEFCISRFFSRGRFKQTKETRDVYVAQSLFRPLTLIANVPIANKTIKDFHLRSKLPLNGSGVKLACATIFSLLLVAAVLSPKLGSSIVRSIDNDFASVAMPNTRDFISINDPITDGNTFKIYYLKPTSQYSGIYNMEDRVSYQQIPQGKNTNTRSVCGNSVTLLGKSYPVVFGKTDNGLEYGDYSVPINTAHKSISYTSFFSCFVLKNKEYTLERSDQHGGDYLKSYPTKNVVASFFTATSFKNCPTVSKGCTMTEVNKPAVDVKINPPPIIEEDINPAAYPLNGYLNIPELSVRVPLTEETKDMYYSRPASSDMVAIGLKKYDAKGGDCRASTSEGSGLIYLGRGRYDNYQKNSSTSFSKPNIQIGAYLYSIYLSGNATKCISQNDQPSFDVLEDVLKWTTVNIKAAN